MPNGQCPSLKGLVGEMVIARIPALGDDMVLVRMHRVEAYGIWIESQNFTDEMLARFHLIASTTTLLLFIPYSGVDFIVGGLHSMALSERVFELS